MASEKRKTKLKKTARRTDGTIFQSIGAAKTKAEKYRRFKERQLGKFGAASPCRRIDPATGEAIPAAIPA